MNIRREKIVINVAITGSFASGKTFILNYIKSLGYKVFSCDDYIKKLYEDINVQKEVLAIFDKLETFDKKQIVNIIYDQPKCKKKLEKYIHPLVRKGIEEFKIKFNSEKKMFFEVPLLFETGFDEYFDYSICAFCSESVRLERAKMRENFDIGIYNKIKKTQMLPEEKIKKADFVINTGLNNIKLQGLIDNILDQMR